MMHVDCGGLLSEVERLRSRVAMLETLVEVGRGTEQALADAREQLALLRAEVERLTADRDALAARLQAVRALHERLAGAWETDFCRHDNQRWPCSTIRLLDASLGTPGDEKPSVLPVEPASNDSVERVWADTIRQVATSDGSYTVEIGGVVIAKAGTPEVADCTEGCTRHATCRDAPGDEKPQPSEPESMVWDGSRDYDPNYPETSAEQIVAWVNANGGEARYVPLGEDTPIGWSGYPVIAVRTAYGWAHMKPGDRIVKGAREFLAGTHGTVREFTVSPVESSGSAE